jgi:hypothetical protein
LVQIATEEEDVLGACELALGHKRFVLVGKRGLCWRVKRPPATLCQHKSSQCWRLSARQHRDLVLAGA